MKQYFAKFLPVKGEIKKGDKVITITGFLKEYSDIIAWEQPTKVKLFLCSCDIQVGDYLFHIPSSSPRVKVLNEEEIPKTSQFFVKVVGEISPNITWVNDGDEFNEDQVNFQYKHRSFRDEDFSSTEPYGPKDWKKGEEEKFTCIVEIECPTCKTFH